MTNYIIINGRGNALFYNAETYSEVIYEYAEYVGISINLLTFKKSLLALDIEEAVELFNDVCLSDADWIDMILSGYNTLYEH